MEKLTPAQIKSANAIIEDGKMVSTTSASRIWRSYVKDDWELRGIEDIGTAAEFLKSIGFIDYVSSKEGNQFRLTDVGLRFNQEGKTIADYLKEAAEKESAQRRKDERDEYYKTLQVRDLEEKLNVMNIEQRDFWKAQKEKNLQTSLIAIISALFSLIALLKTWGFFD